MDNQQKVLLADSSAVLTGQLQTALAQDNRFQVVGAVNHGENLPELVHKLRPDVLVLDLTLPGMDAIQVLRRIRELEHPPEILTTSSYISIYIFRYLVSLGVSYFLHKPCAASTIVEHIHYTANRRRLSHHREESDPQPEDYCAGAAQTLRQLGVPTKLKGYHHIVRAVEMVIADPTVLSGITKILYPTLARECRTTPERVERNIRTAVDAAWNRSTVEIRQAFFGHCDGTKPTNSRFIELLTQHILLRSLEKKHDNEPPS